MDLTLEALDAIERVCAHASIWTLKRCISNVSDGLASASPEAQDYGRALLLKLEHLAAQQQAPFGAQPWRSGCNDFIAPAMTLAEPVRAAA
jgi:hypothetical protein